MQGGALRIRDLAAGGGEDGVAGRDIPFVGRRKAGIDIDRALRHPGEFDRRAERLPDRAGPALYEGFGPASPCERLTATDPGTAGCGRLRVWIGSAGGAFAVVSRSAPRPTIPRQISPSAGAPMMPNNGVPFVTSARLTVNSSRPATNSLVPSSGSIRKKLPS